MTYSGHLGDQDTGFYTQTLAPKKYLRFFLQFYLNKIYVEVAINNFTAHLIILKWPRRQKCRQTKIKMKPKEPEVIKETVFESVFIHSNM